MNVIVHIHDGKVKHGYELGTRQAWKCGDKSHEITRVIGVIKSKIVCVIDGVYAELSTPENNPAHNNDCVGRYIFLGGKCWTELQFSSQDLPKIMYKKISGLNQGHRYMSNDELEQRIS
ncbi:acyl-CoA synthetase [Aliivibrio fischeri]|jgi:hypothetical protein|uniref:acyl-CoA synthetase n=1 Tax=Aliivibrio fischeri TaxID=668 RepID=UPI00080E2A03|nr:acyl-CoA synthetase [Aliivibrio fischeri]MCE4937497.1 acyl-CoA synthetase [Aliivibrio fischeri]OCH29849.1 acyl-CoA synthetase [Aliivibrio fischeri]